MFRLGDPLGSFACDCEDVAIKRAHRMDPPSRERAGTSELSAAANRKDACSSTGSAAIKPGPTQGSLFGSQVLGLPM